MIHLKRLPNPDIRDCGVTVAQQTFNLPGEGSTPFGPTTPR